MSNSRIDTHEREEWQALVDADTLHMLPVEAHIASVRHLAQRLLDLTVGVEMLAQYNELAGELLLQTHPILPKPQWAQDVAYVAFVIDGMRDQIAKLREFVKSIAEQDPMSLETVGQGPSGDVCMFCDAVEWSGTVTHDPACIWQRAKALIEP